MQIQPWVASKMPWVEQKRKVKTEKNFNYVKVKNWKIWIVFISRDYMQPQ